MSTDSLWASYDISNRIGWEYKGCYYLLDKQLDKFRQYLTDTAYPNNQPWPRHYQEAWLILEEADSTLTGKIQVQPDIRKSYQRLKQLMNSHSQRIRISRQSTKNSDTPIGSTIISNNSKVRNNHESLFFTQHITHLFYTNSLRY